MPLLITSKSLALVTPEKTYTKELRKYLALKTPTKKTTY